MTTFTALTTLSGPDAAERLGSAMERLRPEPSGIGVFEIEDGSGLWEVGGYFTEPPDATALALPRKAKPPPPTKPTGALLLWLSAGYGARAAASASARAVGPFSSKRLPRRSRAR